MYQIRVGNEYLTRLPEDVRENIEDTVLPDIKAEVEELMLFFVAERAWDRKQLGRLLEGLSVFVEGGDVVVQVDGFMKMSDQGAPSFDMKPGLLKGKEYVDVPLDYSYSGVDMRGIERQISPQMVKEAKRMRGQRRPRRISGPDLGVRRVSKTSKPDSWIHPGMKANRYTIKAEAYLRDRLKDVMDEALQGVEAEKIEQETLAESEDRVIFTDEHIEAGPETSRGKKFFSAVRRSIMNVFERFRK